MRVAISRQEAIELISNEDLLRLSIEERESILLDWWSIDEEDYEYTLLPQGIQEELKSNDSFNNPSSAKYHPLLLVALQSKYKGVKNEYLLERLRMMGVAISAITGTEANFFNCPCCGYKTLEARGHYFVCPVCFWEDDGNDDPNHYSGPNHMRLREAQENFNEFGACSSNSVMLVDKDGLRKYLRESHHG